MVEASNDCGKRVDVLLITSGNRCFSTTNPSPHTPTRRYHHTLDDTFSDPGLFHHFTSRHALHAPAVFIDRDGVIVEEVGYLHRIADIQLIPRAPEAVAALNAAAVPAIVVTNQAGIGRGYFSWEEFQETQTAIESTLQKEGARLDGVWACAYHPDGVGEFRKDHPFRKPNPGMLLDAAKHLGLDLSRSWMVGDKLLDLESAQAAGLAGAVLVRTGYGRELEPRFARLPPGACSFHVAEDLFAAVRLILSAMGKTVPQL